MPKNNSIIMFPVFWPNQDNLSHSMARLDSTLVAAPECVVAAWVVRPKNVGRLALYRLRQRKSSGTAWVADPDLQHLYQCVAVALLAGDRNTFTTAWAANFGRACCVQAMSRSDVSSAIAASLPDLRDRLALGGGDLAYETVKLAAYSDPQPHADFSI